MPQLQNPSSKTNFHDNCQTASILVVGTTAAALNACIWLASLQQKVLLLADVRAVADTLASYGFDPQLKLAWRLFNGENAIQVCDDGGFDERVNDAKTHRTIWLFVDDECFSPSNLMAKRTICAQHTLIISGSAPIGKIDELAQQFASQQVFYVPFIFMKDGANFNAFFTIDLLLIGEKTPHAAAQSFVLTQLQNNAKTVQISDIKTIEFARAALLGMLATRLSYINELARLADSLRVDITKIATMIGQDPRVGGQYLQAGWGFGGTSLPSELNHLIGHFAQSNVDTALLKAVADINADQKEWLFRKFWQYYAGQVRGKTVLIWGAGYRRGTGRTVGSAIHPLLSLFWSYGIATFLFVEHTRAELLREYDGDERLLFVDNPYRLLTEGSCRLDGLFIINWGAQPVDINALNHAQANKALPIFDGKNILSIAEIDRLQGDYIGIGRLRIG